MPYVFFVDSGHSALLIDLQSDGVETLWVPRQNAVERQAARDVGAGSRDEYAVLLPWLLHMNAADVLWRLISFRERLLEKRKFRFKCFLGDTSGPLKGGGGGVVPLDRLIF